MLTLKKKKNSTCSAGRAQGHWDNSVTELNMQSSLKPEHLAIPKVSSDKASHSETWHIEGSQLINSA